MKIYAYHRTTSTDSNLEPGLQNIKNYALSAHLTVEKIYTDTNIGPSFEMPDYQRLKRDLAPKDILILTDLDLLGRLKKDVVTEILFFRNHNIRLRILKYPITLIELSSESNTAKEIVEKTCQDLLMEVYELMSKKEAARRSQNQKAGIQSMKDSGEWERYGRKRLMTLEEFGKEYQVVINGELKPFELMHKLDMKIPTFYKYRDEYLKMIGKK
jgi:DNA invertase Pin-like site-specific DNA recombinase